MESNIHAGIELDGPVLRYAEVERVGGQARLLRLGECDFPFDPFVALRDGDAEGMDILQEALGDVFSGSQADGLRLALHPSKVLTWLAPFPKTLAYAERNARLRRETALMAGGAEAPEMNLTMQALYTAPGAAGEAVDWVQVVALPREMQSRVEQASRALARPGSRVGLSTQGTATVVGALGRMATAEPDKPIVCGLGLYADFTEYIVVRDGNPVLSSAGEALRGTDALFVLLRLLKQLGQGAHQVGGLYVYGSAANRDTVAALPSVFGSPARPINPLRTLMVEDPDAADPYEASAYAPCVGVAL